MLKLILILISSFLVGEIITVGNGSYTTTFPGYDEVDEIVFLPVSHKLVVLQLIKKFQLMTGGLS